MSDKNPELDAYKKGFEDGFEMAKRLGLIRPVFPIPTYPIQPISPSVPTNPWWPSPVTYTTNQTVGNTEYTARFGESSHWGNNTATNPHVHLNQNRKEDNK